MKDIKINENGAKDAVSVPIFVPSMCLITYAWGSDRCRQELPTALAVACVKCVALISP